MERPEDNGAAEAAERVASFLQIREPLKKKITYRVALCSPRHIFQDGSGQTYTVYYHRRTGGYHVLVEPPENQKKRSNPLLFRKNFLVRGKSLFLYNNLELVAEYLFSFLKKRNYAVEKVEWKEIVSFFRWHYGQGIIHSGGFSAQFQVTVSPGSLSAWLKDSEEEKPYFCAIYHQFLFSFRKIVPVKKDRIDLNQLLLSYSESEIKTTSANPLAQIKRAIYGFKSQNLRAFYGREGLMPEVRRVIHMQILLGLAPAMINASVFVRVAERLQRNTWYTLAAGALAFLRVPAEIINMRRSLKTTQGLPSSRLQKMGESEEFRAIYESKPFRAWRNFERAYTDLFRSTEYLPEKVEIYRLAKPTLYKLVAEGKKEKLELLLKEELGLTEETLPLLLPLAEQLQPFNRQEIVQHFTARVNQLRKEGLLRESEWPNLVQFIAKDLPELLERDTIADAYKLFNDALKRAERSPKKEELFQMVNHCYHLLIPFRRADFFLYLSLFAIGYGATYSSDLPTLIFPIYYLFNGIMVQLIASGFERLSNPVWMQYVFRELESDPAVPSASDVWNEFNSQLMRLLTLSASAGLILGITGRLLAKATHNLSWFGMDGLAIVLFALGIREWFGFYKSISRRCRMES